MNQESKCFMFHVSCQPRTVPRQGGALVRGFMFLFFLFFLAPAWAAPAQAVDCAAQCVKQEGEAKKICEEACKLNFGLKPVGAEAVKGEKGGAAKPLFKERSVPQIIGQILGGLLSLTGTIFFILMLYGGGLWMSARGEESQVEKAKNVILHSIIGLVATSFSYVIIQFIFSRFVPAA